MFSPKGERLPRGWPGRIEGDRVVQLAAQTLQVFLTAGGALREHAVYPLAEVDLRAPVLQPPGIRIFADGLDFVFGNTAAVVGPGDEVRRPAGAGELRSRPAVAAVIGAGGAIGGFTAANAWLAPELPGAKRYDFALSLGPVLVTADELGVTPEWRERVEHAARNTLLRPGELLVAPFASAAVEPGPVRVHVEGIGTLANVVV